MKQHFRFALRRDRAFTLLEMLVAIILIGLLLAIGAPAFLGNRGKAYDARAKQTAALAYRSAKSTWWRIDNNTSYTPAGTESDPAGAKSLIGSLRANEPGIKISAVGTDATDDKVVMVKALSPDIAAYAVTSKSGKTFCLETVERQVGSYAPGTYWSAGYGTQACGQPQGSSYIAGRSATPVAGIPGGAAGPGGSVAGTIASVTQSGGTVSGRVTDPTSDTWVNQPTPLPVPFNVTDVSGPSETFPNPGIIALMGMQVGNNSVVAGAVASNGQISFGKNGQIGNVMLGPGAPAPSFGSGTSTGQIVQRTAAQGPWLLQPVDPGLSATVNNNAALSGVSGVSYNAQTRALTLNNNSTITLPAGTYNLCSITMGNAVTFRVPANSPVRIYVDSPDDPSSKCPAGSGGITLQNQNVTFDNQGTASNLEIFVYGFDDGSQTIDLANTAYFKGAFYAPQSTLVFKNSATVIGGLGVRNIQVKNNLNYTWTPELGDLQMGT